MILGFLSIVTYLVESYGILEYVCDKTLGTATDRYEFMKDLLEDVHYTIFFVMFIFIVFVLYLVSFGSWQARQWERMEAAANELVHFEQTDDSHGIWGIKPRNASEQPPAALLRPLYYSSTTLNPQPTHVPLPHPRQTPHRRR